MAKEEPDMQIIIRPCWLSIDVPTLQKGYILYANTRKLAPENQETKYNFTTPILNPLNSFLIPCCSLIFEVHYISGTAFSARAVTNLDFTIKRFIFC